MLNGKLRISPMLPETWKRLHFYFYWHGQKLSVNITHDEVYIKNLTGANEIALDLNGEEVLFLDEARKSLLG
jgi:trehalose/maltose hydrolase-like predicted phosphorylase